MVRAFRLAVAALVLGTTALAATGASAHGVGGGLGGFHGGLHIVGGHGWGGHGLGWGGGWGYARIGYRPIYGGCYLQRFVDVYGDIGWQRVCY